MPRRNTFKYRQSAVYSKPFTNFIGGFDNAFDQAQADFDRGEAEGNRIRGFQNQSFSGGADLLGGLGGNINDIGGYQADFRQQGLDFTNAFNADRSEAFSQQRGDEESMIAGGMQGFAQNRERALAEIERNPDLTPAQRAQLRTTLQQDSGAQQNQFVTQAREAGRQERQGMFSNWGDRRLQSQTMSSGALQNAMGSAATAGGMRTQGAGAYGNLGSSMSVVPVTSMMDTQAGAMMMNNRASGKLTGISGGIGRKGFMSNSKGLSLQDQFAQNSANFNGRDAKTVNVGSNWSWR